MEAEKCTFIGSLPHVNDLRLWNMTFPLAENHSPLAENLRLSTQYHYSESSDCIVRLQGFVSVAATPLVSQSSQTYTDTIYIPSY